MGDRKLKRSLHKYLQQSAQKVTEAEKNPDGNGVRLEETIKLCTEIMREQELAQKKQEEPRTGFVQYLSDIFRFDGISIFGLQAVVLCITCLTISTVADIPEYLPIFMPLFVLALVPAMFRCQYYGMSEIEAATRASSAQIVLAKLILVGAANLVCMTVLISLEVHLQNSYSGISRMILYCLVPYLVCMTGMLRLIRLRRKENMQICMVLMLGSCACWGLLAINIQWLYEASALGIWIAAFIFFAAFFIKEIYYILAMRKEGKIYGIIN
ncbi:MAG: hypothetical protein HDR12_17220 [Lachnospiraceae bacterium]|nr:hypothetical protein [Lachnospiraceae bacterium]